MAKRYFCDRCEREIDIDRDGFAQMHVMWWSRGGSERMEYKPDFRHRDGYERDEMLERANATARELGVEL